MIVIVLLSTEVFINFGNSIKPVNGENPFSLRSLSRHIKKFIGRLLFTLVFGSNPLFFLESICDDHFPKKLFFLLFLDVIALNYYSLSVFVFIYGWNDSVHEKNRNKFSRFARFEQKTRERRSHPKNFSLVPKNYCLSICVGIRVDCFIMSAIQVKFFEQGEEP